LRGFGWGLDNSKKTVCLVDLVPYFLFTAPFSFYTLSKHAASCATWLPFAPLATLAINWTTAAATNGAIEFIVQKAVYCERRTRYSGITVAYL